MRHRYATDTQTGERVNDNEYHAHELDKLSGPEGVRGVKIKLTSDEGETRWLSLDDGKYRRLVNLLTSGNN